MPESSRRHHSHHGGGRHSTHHLESRSARAQDPAGAARPRSSAGSSAGGGSASGKLPRSSAAGESHSRQSTATASVSSGSGARGKMHSASARSLRSSGGSRTSVASGCGSGFPPQVSSHHHLTNREHDYIARHISDQLRTNYKTLYQAYQAIDMDRDGHIDRSETRRFLTKQGFSTKVADQFYDRINSDGSKGVSYPKFQKQFHDGYELASYKDLASASQAVHSPTLLKVCTGVQGSDVQLAGKAKV